MTATLQDTLMIIKSVIACVAILGIVIFVNYVFSRDKIVTRTLKHQ